MRLPVIGVLGVAVGLGVISGSCGGKSPTEPTPVCTVTIAPASAAFQMDGGNGALTVSTASGCNWTATASAGWIAIASGATGTGGGTATYTVAANPAQEARSGSVTIADRVHAVSQAGRPLECSYGISPTSASVNKDATTGAIAVTAPASCGWTATSSAPWLVLADSGQGAGNGSVSYAVARNPETGDRTATIRIADQTFTMTQFGDTGGCQYSVAPVDLSVCMAGGTLTTTVTTQPNCTWTVSPDVSWLQVSGGSGTGTGPISVTVRDNYDAPRAGTLQVRWPTPTAGQNVRVAQAGCRYAVSRNTFAFTAAGGSGTFDVIQQSDPTSCGGATQDRCVWSAVADVSWITITSSMPRSGDNPAAFSVAANDSATARVGTITVRDIVVTITQPGK